MYNPPTLTFRSNVSLLRRLGAIAYDWLILLAVLLLWTLVWTMAGIHLEQKQYVYYALSVYFIIFAYFAWFWCGDGQTIGMTIWKIRLLGARPINLRVAVTRFAVAIISTLCLGAGFLWVLVSSRHCAWHDNLSGSYLARTDQRQ